MKRLICEECGSESSPEVPGWRGYLDDDEELRLFCPSCAVREFETRSTPRRPWSPWSS